MECKRNINVLMIGNHPSNKGGMTSVINQMREHDWLSEGIEIRFISTFLPGNSAKKIFYFIIAYLRIIIIFFFNKPDIVHMHMSYKGSFTRKYLIHKLCKVFKVKDIIHLHGSEFGKWYNEVDDKKRSSIVKLLNECDKFIVLGQRWKSVIQRIAPNAKVEVVSNGIEIPSVTVNWNDQRCTALFLGVLIPRKGVLDLVKAVKEMRDSDELGNLHFVIAGSGEEEEKLKSEVHAANLDHIISFAGWVSGDKKRDLILNSQILVSPSYNEGLPISILEAASYGMPIISTDVGDIPAVVKHGINGILFEPGDICALVEGIKYVSNKVHFHNMSTESRRIIEESFSVSTFYEKLLNIYVKLGRG